jgi:hypothetical protein
VGRELGKSEELGMELRLLGPVEIAIDQQPVFRGSVPGEVNIICNPLRL